MSGKASHAPRRTPRVVSRAERIVSWIILATLPAIAGAVYVKGRAYDPNLFALDPAALAASRTAGTRTPEPVSHDPELPISSSLLPQRLPALDWTADGPVERFTRATLYQKIDGRADEYLRDGFVQLEAISYARGNGFIDVLLYDMANDVHARARFLAERPPQNTPAVLGSDGYCVAASCFFVNERYYVQVIGSDPGAEGARAVNQVARAIALATSTHQRHP